MAIRIIYDQTQPATANGEATGWIQVLDVTQLVAGCTGFIYDHDTGPIAVRVEAIDSPNSKLQLSRLDDSGSYVVGSLVAYTVTSGTAVKIPQQAREDSGYVPPAGGAIAGIAAGASTAGSGFVTFANSNGVTFGMSNNLVTASVATAGGGGNLALSAGLYSTNSGTVLFRNSNGMSFGMDTNGEITGSYTVPNAVDYVFSNSNNVTFGLNGSTYTASASFSQTVQTQGLVNIEGSTGSIHFDNANGISFGGSNNTITASVVIPPQTVQTQNMVSVAGSTGAIVFGNANGISFGGTNSTITASYTVPAVPAQTVQPVAASASNGSFAFSTLGFNQGGGVTFSTNINGINAVVKTDYQSSNANYLTSQTVQPGAVSGSNGSFTYSTLSLGASNGATFYTTNGSIVVSYTVPSVPAQTYQPGAYSGSNGSFTASTLSFGQSNGLTFYTTNGSLVASYTVPAIPGATVFSNSNNVTFGLNGSTITASASFAGGGLTSGAGFLQGNTTGQSSSSTYALTSLNVSGAGNVSVGWSDSTLIISATGGAGNATVFSNSNNVTFGLNGSTVTASASFVAQTAQPVAASASNGSFNFSTLKFVEGSGVTWATQANGIQASVKTDYQSSNANYLTSQSNQAFSASGGSSAFQTLNFANSNGVTFTNTGGSVAISYTVPGATVFSNSNNVTFGLNGSTVTASASFTAQTVQPVAASASNGSFNFSTLKFVEGSGVTWATQVGGIQASVKTDYQSSNANYLTSQSNQAFSASGGSSTFQTLGFSNQNNVTFSNSNGSIVASASFAQSVQPVAVSGSNGSFAFSTLTFGVSNGATFYTTNNSIVVSYTVPTQSTQGVAASGSNGSFTFSTISFGQSNGATFYTTNGSVVVSYTVPAIPGATVFSNSNNVTFGLNGSTVTADAQMRASASNGSFVNSHIKFVEGSGVTWATQVNGIQASVKTDYQSSNANYLTSQSNQAFSASGGSSAFQTLNFANSNGVTFTNTGGSVAISYTVPGATVFSNSNNVTFGLNGSTVTASASFTAQTVQPVAASASNGSFNFSTLKFVEGSGVTWATQVGGIQASVKTDYQSSNANYLTSQSNQAFSASGGSSAFQTLNFANSNGVTFTNTGGSVAISYTVPGATVFSNSNNVTFGLNGSTVTASASFTAQTVQPVAASASNGSYNFSTLKFVEGSGVTWATQANGIQASVKTDYQSSNANYLTSQSTGPAAIAVPGTTVSSGTIIFSNSNGVSFGYGTGTASNIITVTVQPGAAAGVAAINAGSAQATSGTVTFADSNGVSFGMGTGGNYGVITASIQAAAASGVGAIQAGTQTVSSGTVTFSNSNNVSFGLGSGASASILTASASFVAQTVQPVAASASNGSYDFSTLKFVEGSGVTWATQANGIQASVKTDYQSSNANYLTSQSNQAFSASGGSSAFQTLNFANSNGVTFTNTGGSVAISYTVPGATVFSNSNNVTFGLNGSTVTASASFTAQTVQPVAASASNGSYNFSTLKFVEGSGVTWATQANGIQASVKTDYQSSNANYLTSQTNQTIGIYNTGAGTFGQSSSSTYDARTLSFQGSGAVSVGQSGGSFIISAPAQSSVTFSNSNNVSFGLNGSTVTANAAMRVSASNGSYSDSHVKFVEGSGVTWATQAGGIQASVKTDYQSSNANYLTSQSNQAFSASGGSSAFQTLGFSNQNNVTFSNSNGSIVASASFAQSVQPVAASGSNGSFAFSTLTFGQSNGATFYTTNNSIVVSYTVPTQSTQAVAASGSNGSFTFSTISFGQSNGATFYTTNGSVVVSYTVPAIPGATVFSNSNNVTFGLNGSTVTADAQMRVSASNGSFANSHIKFVEGSGVTWATQANGIQASVKTDYQSSNANYLTSQSNQAFSAPGGSSAFQTLVFANSQNVSFSNSNGSVVASVQDALRGLAGVYITGGLTTLSGNADVWVAGIGNAGVLFSTSNATGMHTIFIQGIAPQIAVPGTTIQTDAGGATNAAVFSNSNGVSFGINGSTITASVNAGGGATSGGGYLQGNTTGQSSSSTYALSSLNVSGAGNISVGWSNSTMIISATGGGGGAAMGISTAGNTQGTSGNFSNGTYIFEGSNGMSVSQLTAATPGVQTLRIVAPPTSQLAAGTNITVSSNGSTISIIGPTFANSNGVTFGVNGQTITASAAGGGAAIGISTAGNTQGTTGTFTSGTYVYEGSNGLSVSQITNAASANVQTLRLIAPTHSGPTGVVVNASASTLTNGNLVLSNSNNVTFGINGSTITAGIGGTHGVVVNASASTLTNGNLVFSNSNNISFGINGSTITAAASQSFSASNGSYSSGVLKFVEGSGVTWATQANGIQASVKADYIAALAVAGSTAPGLSTIYFSNGNVTFGLNGSVMTASANAGAVNQTGPNIAAGAQTVTNGTVIFSNSNGVSFGLGAGANSTQMTASVAEAKVYWAGPPWHNEGAAILTAGYLTLTAMTQRPFFLPFQIPGDMIASQLRIKMSRSTNAQSNAFTVQNGIYSMVNSTSMALISSTQVGFSDTNTGTISGIKIFQMPIGLTSLSKGQYYLGLMFSANGGNTISANYLPMGAATSGPAQGSVLLTGTNNYAVSANNAGFRFWGRLSATAQMPANVVTADLSSAFAGGSSALPMHFTIANFG